MRFLLVDDHPIFRNSLRGLLKYLYPGACFLECDNAVDTQALLEKQTPDFIIVDLELLDGVCFDLIRAIKRKHKHIPVLVVSMHEDSRIINQALQAGADGYVSKREDSPVVKEAVAQLLERKKYLSQTISNILVESIQTPQVVNVVDYAVILSEREYEVFKMLGREMPRKVIAEKLDVSIPTINTHIDRMKKKLRLDSTMKLVYTAIKSCNESI